MNRWTVTMDPRRDATRILMMEGREERLRAVLGPSASAHPRAASTLLEGLALRQQRPLCVVLCADTEDSMSALRLEDALGFGVRNLHFDVEVMLRGPADRRRAGRLGGLGCFGDLRQVCLQGVSP